jgi:hypothetical protein
LGPEAIYRVLGTGACNSRNGEISPLRKLIRKQTPNQSFIGIELVGVNPIRAHPDV